MADKTRPVTTEPAQPPTAPEEGELQDDELDAITGGDKNTAGTMQMISTILKQQSDMQKKIIQNL